MCEAIPYSNLIVMGGAFSRCVPFLPEGLSFPLYVEDSVVRFQSLGKSNISSKNGSPGPSVVRIMAVVLGIRMLPEKYVTA